MKELEVVTRPMEFGAVLNIPQFQLETIRSNHHGRCKCLFWLLVGGALQVVRKQVAVGFTSYSHCPICEVQKSFTLHLILYFLDVQDQKMALFGYIANNNIHLGITWETIVSALEGLYGDLALSLKRRYCSRGECSVATVTCKQYALIKRFPTFFS